MKRTTRILLTALAVATLGAGMASADPWTARVERRHARQHERIARGVHCGQIARGELRRLRRAEASMRRTEAGLRRVEARLRARGRALVRERARVERQLDRQSERIWRFRHNGRCYVL